MKYWTVPVIFFTLFLTIYGGVHFYLYRRIRSYADFPSKYRYWLAGLFAVMVISPVLSRIIVWDRFFLFGYVFTYVSSLWIGYVFYLLITTLSIDLVNSLHGIAARLRHSPDRLLLPRNMTVLAATITLPFLICVYAYVEALNIRTTYLTIKTQKLPQSMEQLTIAQISDVHLGMIVREGRLERLIKVLNAVNPDIIVSTGDLLDQEVDSINHLADLLAVLRPPLGKYAVMGNHEFYAGPEKAAGFIVRAGFKLLRGECLRLQGRINIIGVDDPAAGRLGFPKANVPALFGERDPNLFTLFLFHRPPNSEHYFERLPIDLQLSGHTHGGQLFPFRLVTRIFYPLKAGFYRLEDRHLYVSGGAGTWGPPLRFLTPPEVVVIRLVRSP